MLVSIAFNNPDLVEYQLRLLRKNCLDNYLMLICDNSNNNSRSKEIHEVCKRYKASYIKLPVTLYPEHPSQSHGSAINWTHLNIVRKYKPKVFGILDHDIFPVKKVSIIKRMQQKPLYGVKETKGEKWYLWPGFSFYDNGFLKFKKVDFRPTEGLDTGGSNWQSIYRKLDKNVPIFAKVNLMKVGLGNDKQEDKVQIVDDSWVHLINGSNWAKKDMSTKFDWLEQLVNHKKQVASTV